MEYKIHPLFYRNHWQIARLRFKGFTDPWEERKLGEVATLSSSKRIHLSDYVTEGIPFYRGSEISTGGITGNQELFISQEKFDEIKEKYGVPSEGDILVTAVGTLGNLWKVDSRRFYYKDGNLIQISKMQVNSDYLLTYFTGGMGKKRLLDSAAGSNQKALTMVKLREITVDFPSEDEQKKIGAFFKQLDHLITLHQRKLAKLKELKQGYLQKLFPKNGAKVPELRFAGFADAWEQRKVSELADRYDNLRVPITASERVAGETPYYGANGIQDYVEGFTHNGEFVLVAEDGANDLQNYPVQYVDGKVWVNNHAHVLQAKEERVDNKFLTNALKHTNIEPYLVGGGRAKLNADVMMKINFKVPTLPEQVQIGSFFKQLDYLITLHQRKLEKLQELKKGYLQKMFC